MKIFQKAFGGTNALLFLDLEGTGATHEVIEIGATLVTIDEKAFAKKVFPFFRTFVKAKGEITSIVTKMTGITEEKLKKEAISFDEAILLLKKYSGKYWPSLKVVTFGKHDAVMLNSSSTMDAKETVIEVRNILKKTIDFQGFLSKYIKDPNGNSYSLVNYLKVFKLEFKGQEHDASFDAYNLYRLYEKAIKSPDIFVEEYKKSLLKNKALTPPLKRLIQTLISGNAVTPNMLNDSIKETFK